MHTGFPTCAYWNQYRSLISALILEAFSVFSWETNSSLDRYLLGADYMANFSPGWNFSPVSRAEISPRPPEQIFLKRRLRLHGENFSPGWDFQPGLWNRAGIFSPGWNSEKPHVIALKFQPGLKSEPERAQWLCFQRNKMAVPHFSAQFQISARAETSHVIATKFQPGGRAEISARAETRHVIGPLLHLGWTAKFRFSFSLLSCIMISV